ncbi:response regulator [Hyphomonas sp.]|uniref:response regulator n=1 Tax=Hyphomonas sp. TaxID=87 RepID=UPI00391B1E20
MAVPELKHLQARIAVIDDNPAVRQSLSVLLQARGYSVESFAGADEILIDIRPGDFNLYVIDFKMDGLNGIGLLAELRRRGEWAPAVMISGWDAPALDVTAERAGFAALVRKPMTQFSLVPVIERLVAP